jgi:hypothetical protein
MRMTVYDVIGMILNGTVMVYFKVLLLIFSGLAEEKYEVRTV